MTSKGIIGAIYGSSAFIAFAVAATFFVTTPAALAEPTAAPSASESIAAIQPDDSSDVTELLTGMNTALREKDRDSFLALVSGSAVAPLTLWWDNMTALGMETGAISLYDPAELPGKVEEGDKVGVQVILGASIGFTAFAPRGSGGEDAGKNFIQGMPYTAMISNQGGLTITDWAPTNTDAPWDTGKLYVARGKHCMIAGLESEKALVDSLVAPSDSASKWVITQYEKAGRELPLAGFNLFASYDDATFEKWYGADDGWKLSVAGFAQPTLRPGIEAPGIDPLIAKGISTSTSYVVIGPLTEGQQIETLAHEFMHVAHYTDAPSSFADPPRVVIEGWAEYQALRFENGNDAFPSKSSEWGRYISYAVDKYLDTIEVIPTNNQVYGEDASFYYLLSSTIYAYAAELGYDVFELAVIAKTTGKDQFTASAKLTGSEPLTSEGWKAWLKANY